MGFFVRPCNRRYGGREALSAAVTLPGLPRIHSPTFVSRLTPERRGQPPPPGAGGSPGLRREAIARPADVNTDYYTRLEQGRNIHPSRAVLDSVARALRLDPGEPAHMIDRLENCATSRPAPIPAQNVRPALRQLLEAVGNVPALVLGRRTDVLAGNPLAFLLLADFPAIPAAERNLTRWIVRDPIASELFPDWETVAAEAVVALRLDVGRHPVVGHLDLNFEDLVLSDDPDLVLRVFVGEARLSVSRFARTPRQRRRRGAGAYKAARYASGTLVG
jgi:hypothetical protein